MTTNIHAILTEAEQQSIVNALAFYNLYWTGDSSLTEPDEKEQWRLCFTEDNKGYKHHGFVDQLATRIANLT